MNQLSKTIVFIVLICALFVGGYFYLSGSFLEKTIAPAPSLAQMASNAPKAKEFTLNVIGRKLVSGSGVLSVEKGDEVRIHITVDEDEELHLHGYDIHLDLKKGKEGTLTLVTSASGRFPFELEHSSTELGALEVRP